MIALVVATLALALTAAAVQAAVDARSSDSRAAGGAAALGGAILVVVLMLLDGGRILRWRYGLGAGADRVELPGAALVLGLALLVTLGGTLAMTAHLASSGPKARLLGQRLLVLGPGLGGLGTGVVVAQGLGRSRGALAAGFLDLAVLLVSIGLLVLGLVRLLSPLPPEVAAVREARSERLLRPAAALAMLAAAAMGLQAWRTEGSYATPAVAEAVSVAVLGLVAVQPTRFALLRDALLLMGLVAMVARSVSR